MIASIEGKISNVGEDSLTVTVGGVGLQIHVPNAVRSSVRVGEDVFLHTHLIVREDLLALYGFETAEERDFYTLLLGVNGVGPRTALACLSSLSVDAIRRAVLSEQPEIFSRVPGVGKKTGQKILLHLQGRISGGILQDFPARDTDSEVLDALTTLGYSVVEAQAALQSIPHDTPSEVEARLRAALQYFSR